jgi:diaminopimelate decarboxylase
MKYFNYKDNRLCCEDIPLKEVAEEYGTPLYVYSKNQITENYRLFKEIIGDEKYIVCYALKANSNPYILKLLASGGAGADVVSAGELYLALEAGFNPGKIFFAGAGKREDEIEYALGNDIFSFNVESVAELQTLSRLAIRQKKTARVSLRVNPDVDALSHPYITTGLGTTKFGIESSKVMDVFRYAASLSSLDIVGVHTHIGSQITKAGPYIATANYIAGLVEKLREGGINLSHVDLGGGFGVQYVNALIHEGLPKEEGAESTPVVADFFKDILPVLKGTGCTVCLEPGRSIIADAGVLITKVIVVKENTSKKFVIVDAGMNDLIRPALYHAYHQIVPLSIDTYEHEKVDIVGPICENSDFFARDRIMPKTGAGDYLAVLTAGAYGFVLGSNYNGRLKPAEILVNGDKMRIIRARQTLKDLG